MLSTLCSIVKSRCCRGPTRRFIALAFVRRMLLNPNREKEITVGAKPGFAVRLAMKTVRIIALIALIAIPSSSYAWSRGGAVVVRPGFSSGVVFARPGFANGVVFARPAFPGRFVAGRLVVNPVLYPRPYYFSSPYIYYYPSSSVYSYSYTVPPSTLSAPTPRDAYDRGYAEGYSQGYEEALKARDKERYEEGKKQGYEQGYEAGKEAPNP